MQAIIFYPFSGEGSSSLGWQVCRGRIPDINKQLNIPTNITDNNKKPT
jgi:hypothetical protein